MILNAQQMKYVQCIVTLGVFEWQYLNLAPSPVIGNQKQTIQSYDKGPKINYLCGRLSWPKEPQHNLYGQYVCLKGYYAEFLHVLVLIVLKYLQLYRYESSSYVMITGMKDVQAILCLHEFQVYESFKFSEKLCHIYMIYVKGLMQFSDGLGPML